PGRRPEGAPGRLPGRPRSATRRRVDLSRGGPTPGADGGQRRKALDAGRGQATAHTGGCLMNGPNHAGPIDTGAGAGLRDASQVDDEDPQVTRVLKDYLESLERGEIPDRQAFFARHPAVADKLAAYFDSLEFIQRAVTQVRSPVEPTPLIV